MNFLRVMNEAWISLTVNKMRSSLTILGIVIGVAAVVAMVAVGRGAQNTITDQISGIGVNLIYVVSGSEQEDVRNPRPLTLADARALNDPISLPDVAAVSPVVSGVFDLSANGETTSVNVSGVSAAYQQIANEEMLEGDFLTEMNESGRSSVVVLGPETADKLFGRREGVVGESVRINGQPFRVIGVLASKGGSSFGSQDNRALVPVTTAMTRLLQSSEQDPVSNIQVMSASAEVVDAAVEQISQALRIRHRTKPGLDDFTVFTQQQILDTASSVTGVLTVFIGGIAAISLLVGGIGIMNIMLVSVAERTREIGLRKALGAKKRDILLQFLTESMLLGLAGGAIGIVLAYILSAIIGFAATAAGTPLSPSITLDAILLATLFSLSVGLLFGIYPANRAASLQPVEALRFE